MMLPVTSIARVLKSAVPIRVAGTPSPAATSTCSRSVHIVPPPRRGVRSFASWVAESCGPDARVLDIGAGCNLSGPLRPLVRQEPYLVGVDPDESILRNPCLDERHQMSMEDFATDHAEQFDAAFAIYVLEHVCHPPEFIAACARVLKPGGSLFALTLNMHQYFGLLTWASTRVGLSDRILERLKTPSVVAAYHFPTQYRLNSIRTVSHHLDAAGFSSVDFRCYDDTSRYGWYLPAGARWFAPVYTRTAYAIGSPELMGHLSFRAVK
jgi:SAM-dependent methyltransferase